MNQDHTPTSKSRSGTSAGAAARTEAETLKNQVGDALERGKAGIAEAKNAASDSLSDPVSNLQAEMANLKDTLARLVSQAGGQTATTMRQVGQSVVSQVGSAAEAGSELATSAKEQAKTFAAELEGMAKRNPLGALAGALLVGVVIGMMSRGRG